jgi:SagB-type dehydrogenase family enzyme
MRILRPFKISPTLIVCWEDDELVCKDYFSNKAATLSVNVITLLDKFKSGKIQDFKDLSLEDIAAVKRLQGLGFLIERGSLEETARNSLESWHWSALARAFAFSLRHANKLTTKKERFNYARNLLRQSPPPPNSKTYPRSPKWNLPRPSGSENGAYRNLLEIRNAEHLLKRPISLSVLSRILFAVWGEQERVKTIFGTLPVKTSRSAGNRYPIEVYPILTNVEGIPRGLYHYDAHGHCLEKIKSGNLTQDAFDIACRQKPFKNAAAYLIMTAVVERTAWKYRHDQGFLMVALDAGHLSQSLYVAAHSFGLGVLTTPKVLRTRAERLLNLDPAKEFVLTISSLGVKN